MILCELTVDGDTIESKGDTVQQAWDNARIHLLHSRRLYVKLAEYEYHVRFFELNPITVVFENGCYFPRKGS